MNDRIKVWIVDDHNLLAEGLCRIINESEVAKVHAVYYDLDSCRKGLTSFRPDVLLLDVRLPDGSGVDFCAEIKKEYPHLKIMILTGYDDVSLAKRSLHNGALGYVVKNAMPEEIIAGIETVHNGELFLNEKMDILMKNSEKDDIIWLAPREKKVLQLISEGYTDPEIADKMYLSRETIKGYRKDLLLKFGSKNSIVLVKSAIEQQLI
ncbi:putative transcriptional regulator, LuxR family protein [Bacteroidia bacterium]|nr:putative transcriptional regulator, LuxR family protein [Bacteroidia bacterium]